MAIRFCCACVLITLVGLSPEAVAASSAITFRTVMLSEERAPDTEDGVLFGGGLALVDQQGAATLFGHLGTGTSDRSGIWIEGTNGLELLARTGMPANGLDPGIEFGLFGLEVFTMRGPGVTNDNHQGIWAFDNGSLRHVVRQGDELPGTPAGSEITSFSRVLRNAQGHTGFKANLRWPGGGGDSLWVDRSGVLTRVSMTGEHAPGTPSTVVFDHIESVVMNGHGRFAFRGGLKGFPLSGANRGGIWSDASGTLELLARSDDPAPGVSPDIDFFHFGRPAINDAGQVAFSANLREPNGSKSKTGIWIGDSSALDLVITRGDPAPGAGPGLAIWEVRDPVLNAAGELAFYGDMVQAGTNNFRGSAIWAGLPDALEMVARTGDQAPGTEPGVEFSNLLNLPNLFHPRIIMNGAGQVAFIAKVQGSGVGSGNDFGIWATDREGQLRLIVREGDMFDVDDDPLVEELRQIRFLENPISSGGQDGFPMTFNDRGELVVELSFWGQTYGSFIANVPEPSSMAMLVLAGVVLNRRRRSA